MKKIQMHRKSKFSLISIIGLILTTSCLAHGATARTPISAADINDLRAGNAIITVNSLADLQSYDRGGLVKTIFVKAHSVEGDGYEGLFRWDSTDHSTATGTGFVDLDTQHGIYVAPSSDTSGASGAWVRDYRGPADIRWFGADGVTDDAPALNAAFSIVDWVQLLPYHKILSQVSIGVDKRISTLNKTIIDATDTSFDVSDGTTALFVGTDDITQISDLSVDVSVEDRVLQFSSEHALSVGDIICIYDPTDYSWSSARPSYRAGEFCEVATVDSATQITISNGLHAGYTAATVDVYKMSTGSFTIDGRLEVKISQPTTGELVFAVKLYQLANCKVSDLTGRGLGGAYTGIGAIRCFNVGLENITAIQETASGTTGDYGLAVSNCQHMRITGYFTASRHGLTHGGYDGPCFIPCRDIQTKGTVKTTYEQGVEALDAHGNCENISFEGTVYGGITPGGSGFKFRGICYAHDDGLCVMAGEIRTFDCDFAYSTFITNKNPYTLASGRGVIDFGGNSTFEVNNMINGMLNLQGITIKAPNASYGVVVRTRNPTVTAGDKIINLRNANIVLDSSGTPIYTNDDGGGNNFAKVLLDGLITNCSQSVITDTDFIENHRETGIGSYTTTISIAYVDVAVSFDQPYPSAKLPTVSISIDRTSIGARIAAMPLSPTNNGFTARIFTVDGTNFDSEITDSFWWSAQ